MALIATVGASDANSYVTVAEADAYFEDRMHSSSWEALEEETKSGLLITSSKMLDWYINWKGVKAETTQSMKWPRSEVTRPDGTEVDDDVIPPEVKEAAYEQALVNIDADRTEGDALAGIEQLKAGSLMIKASSEVGSEVKPIPTHVYNIVSDLYNRNSVVRLLRA